MSIIDLTGPMTITAPASSDGWGQAAVLNSPTSDTDFIGYLTDASGLDGPPVRSSFEELPEAHGATFSPFFHGPRSFTLEVQIALAATYALSNARRDKLYRATNMMAANGSITWTESGGSARLINCRREQPPRGPDFERKTLLSFIASDPRILSGGTELNSGAASTSESATNGGNAGASPRIEIASPSATTTITNTTTSQTLTLTGLDGSGTLIVDFGARTVTRGGVDKYAKVSFPSSVWWELKPGANTVTMTNAGIVYWRDSWI